MLPDFSAPFDVLLGIPVGGRNQVAAVGRGLQHIFDREEEVLPGRPCLPESIGNRVQVEPLETRLGQPVRGRRPDRGCAADNHVLDRNGDVLSVLRFVNPEVEGQVTLVDQLHKSVLEPDGSQLARGAIEGDVQEAPPRGGGGRRGGSRDPAGPIPVSSRG